MWPLDVPDGPEVGTFALAVIRKSYGSYEENYEDLLQVVCFQKRLRLLSPPPMSHHGRGRISPRLIEG